MKVAMLGLAVCLMGSAFAVSAKAPQPVSGNCMMWNSPSGDYMKPGQWLHDQLKIQPNQESAWQKFMDTRMEKMMQHRDMSGTAVERMEARHAVGEKQIEAFKALYETLTPEQKKIADSLMGTGMGAGMGKGMGRGKGMH